MIFEKFKIPGTFRMVKMCIKNQVSSDLRVDGHKRMIEKADKTRRKPADIWKRDRTRTS